MVVPLIQYLIMKPAIIPKIVSGLCKCNCRILNIYPLCQLIRYYCVVLQNYPTPHRSVWKFQGGVGPSKGKTNFKGMYEAQLEFPEGEGGLRENPLSGGGMDILRNYTFMVIMMIKIQLV